MNESTAGLLRTLSFYDAYGYPLTRVELFSNWDAGAGKAETPSLNDLEQGLAHLLENKTVVESRGRIVFAGREVLIFEHGRREGLFPRKIRHARQIVWWLRRLSGVRFVALCNTVALAQSRNEGDLDFFIIAKYGTVWQTRGWGVLPFKLMDRRPKPGHEQDTACFSFFVDDRSLDMAPLQLDHDDVYFRHWFLSLLPLYDDGVSADLWKANEPITVRHPFARPWILSPDLKTGPVFWRVLMPSILEPSARRWQERALPATIQSAKNRDTRVVVNDHVLKFHVEDGREAFREAYLGRCKEYGVEF